MTVILTLPCAMTRRRSLGLAILLMFFVQWPAAAFAQEPEPSITLTAPVNGEWLLAGTTYTISWTATNVPEGAWFRVSSDSTTPGVQNLPYECSSLTSDTRTCAWRIDKGALTCPERLDTGCNPDLMWPWSRLWVRLYDWRGALASAEVQFTVVTRPAAWAGPFLFVTDRATQALWRIDAITGDKQRITSGGYLQRPGGVGIGGFQVPWRREWSGQPHLPSDDRNVYIADETGLIRVDSHTGEQVVIDAPATHVTVNGSVPLVTMEYGGVGVFPYLTFGEMLFEDARGIGLGLYSEIFVADSAAFGGGGGVIGIDGTTWVQYEACSGLPFDTPVAVAVQAWEGTLVVADTTALGNGALISCVDGQPQRVWPIEAPSDLVLFHHSAFVVSPQSGNVTRVDLDTGIHTVLAHLEQPVGIELSWGTPPISVSIAEASVVEGDFGVTGAALTVTLSAPSDETMKVDYETLEGSATEGTDFVPTFYQTLTFAPGVTSMQLTIPVIADRLGERDESFRVALGDRDLGMDYGVAEVHIVDDDTPALRIDDANTVEGSSSALVFPVTSSLISTYPVTVEYEVRSINAVRGVGGVLTIPSGVQTAAISIPITDNHLDEADRVLKVVLFNPSNAVLDDSSATGTIVDDDPLPRLSIADLTVAEKANNFQLRVTLSEPSGRRVDVAYRTTDGSALAEGDYTARSGTVSFLPGATTASIALRVTDDVLRESTEQFFVTLSPTSTAVIEKSKGVVTILDNDR
jgi:hypothetical protein